MYPGVCLGNIDAMNGGSGVYTRGNQLYASISGVKQIGKEDGIEKPTVNVVNKSKVVASDMVLKLDDVVTCRVTRITNRKAIVEILLRGDIVLHEPVAGVIQKEDVRLTDTDNVDMEKSFQPEQIVRATVRSYGDSHSYFLSTAKPDMGVLDRIN